MSYINNMNPRRMIWFNQNAPKNKMDLWLSYNQHYEDTDDEAVDPQQTTDNPSQRKCDLILKAWDCGQWIPIVGFNTTAANKIDLANTTDIGGIKAAVHGSGVTTSRLVEAKLYPVGDAKFERLSVDSDDIIDNIISTFNDDYPLLIGGNGIILTYELDHSLIKWEVANLKYADSGKYAVSDIDIYGHHTILWVDLPEGTTDTWRPIKVNGVAKMDDSSSGNTMNIVAGKGIYIGTTSGSGNTSITVDVLIRSLSYSTSGNLYVLNGETITYSGISSGTIDVIDWNIYGFSNYKSFDIQDWINTLNPIFIQLDGSGNVVIPSGTTVIDPEDCIISNGSSYTLPTGYAYFITLLYGMFKFEKIKTL